jgi:hypothetical protein
MRMKSFLVAGLLVSSLVLPAAGQAPRAGSGSGGTSQKSSKEPNAAEKLIEKVRDAVGLSDRDAKTIQLFNGRDLEHFYTWIEGQGVFVDIAGVFSIQDGLLRISGEHQGYLATRERFSDYRLIVEYKYGEQTWGARRNKPRNSGVLVHAVGLDKEWMKSIECQIDENGTGDLVLHDGARLTVGGETKSKPWTTFPRSKEEVEFVHGKWNTMEVLCQGPMVRVTINGHVVNEGLNAGPSHGKIALQSNGAEIFFRRLELHLFNTTNAAPASPTRGK